METVAPQEILHYTLRDDYRALMRRRRQRLIENTLLVLICLVAIALTFYAGVMFERHIKEVPSAETIIKTLS